MAADPRAIMPTARLSLP